MVLIIYTGSNISSSSIQKRFKYTTRLMILVLFSRQFIEVKQAKVSSLLTSFPKLLSNDKIINKSASANLNADLGLGDNTDMKRESYRQNTILEFENLRFLYQKIDSFYLILLTNINSNIIQDLETLRLLYYQISEYSSNKSLQELKDASFEIMFAFDEIISLGQKENTSTNQLKVILEMESHEEQIQEIIAKNKEIEAKEISRRKAKQIDKEKKEARLKQLAIKQQELLMSSSYDSPAINSPEPVVETEIYEDDVEESEPIITKKKPAKKGMSLAKGMKNRSNTES